MSDFVSFGRRQHELESLLNPWGRAGLLRRCEGLHEVLINKEHKVGHTNLAGFQAHVADKEAKWPLEKRKGKDALHASSDHPVAKHRARSMRITNSAMVSIAIAR